MLRCSYILMATAILVMSCSDDHMQAGEDASVDAVFAVADLIKDTNPDIQDVLVEAQPDNDTILDVVGDNDTTFCVLDDDCVGSFQEIGQCEDAVCESDECTVKNATDGSLCNASTIFCTDDMCEGGVCVQGEPSEFSDGNPCTEDVCVKGVVVHSPVADPIQCDDGDPCTQDDTCFLGNCKGGLQVSCLKAACASSVSCQDGECVQVYNPAGTSCDDGDPCTVDEVCDESHACVSLATGSCDDGNPCTDDVCNPADGCVSTPNTASCDDGDACTQNDVCANGFCMSGSPLVCDDGDTCNGMETCNSASGCEMGVAFECDDNNLCTDDSCQGGVCNFAPNSLGCDDGDVCTTGDVCAAGVCGGVAVDCSDDVDCTTDECDPSGVCIHTKSDEACDDSDDCTTDTCDAVVGCQHVPVGGTEECCMVDQDCNDGIACTLDTCDTVLGCSHTPNDAACNDGNTCTDDVCTLTTGCVNVSAEELCDGIDNDCDGETDEEVGGPGNCGCLGEPCPSGFSCTAEGTCEDQTSDEVFVPAGEFWMGCNVNLDPICVGGGYGDEKPQHLVTVPAYFIDRTEVTSSNYGACVIAGACTEPTTTSASATYGNPAEPNNPINHVKWGQSGEYCGWSGKPAGIQRLCTEAEWEMAARGSCVFQAEPCQENMRTFPWGEALATCATAVMEGCPQTQPFGSKPAGVSPYGVVDMSGNVREWVQDCFGLYSQAPTDGSAANNTPCTRVNRNGSWRNSYEHLRAGKRRSAGQNYTADDLGFRCCRSVP